MEFFPEAKDLLKAALDGKWEDVEKQSSSVLTLIFPLSEHNDNILHFLVHNKRIGLLSKIVEKIHEEWDPSFLSRTVNVDDNTVLHEAAISGNLEAVEFLVDKNKELLEMKNKSGETPLFRAAAFGKTKVVKFLASCCDRDHDEIHCKREDGASILFAAVQGKHFGTALEVLNLYEHISRSEDEKQTSLHMLAKMPSALKSEQEIGTWRKFLHLCVPVGRGHDDDADNIEIKRKFEGTKSGLQSIGPSVNSDDHNRKSKHEHKKLCLRKVLVMIYSTYLSIWNLINRGCPLARKIWKEKRENEFANKLARKLIQDDLTWEKSVTRFGGKGPTKKEEETEQRIPLFTARKENSDNYVLDLHLPALKQTKCIMEDEEECGDEEEREYPFLAAIRTGNVQFVKLTIDEYPQVLTQTNHRNQNILHLAAMYRQKEIFNLVRKKKILMIRLAREIDVAGYTVLHCVSDTKHYVRRTSFGPAYQLQAELAWFKRVEKIMPAYYMMLQDKNKNTAYDIFKKKHKELQKEAQQWMKDTSQSCSAVAVLVATVVFAAAFTVPGGTNDENGQPILINSPFFLFFTVMDVIALSCSLTAVVIFLSILTSPFELDDFFASLHRRLTLGFALLFMSVATTMFAFASTIFLVIRLDNRRPWTTTLICSASFFPVSVLALTHFPLSVSFINAWRNLFKLIWNAFPCNLVTGPAIDRLKRSSIYEKVKASPQSLRKKFHALLED